MSESAARAGALEDDVSAAACTSPRAASTWIQSAPWDLFWIFSALWGGALLLIGASFEPVLAFALFVFGFKTALAACHAWSTTYMVVLSPLLAEERRAHRWSYVWLPAGIVACSLALGITVAATSLDSAGGVPGIGLWAFWLYIGSFMLGHFWHFGRQDFGVLSLYRERAGQTRPIDRRVDSLFTSIMMYAIQPSVYLSVFATTAFSEMVFAILPISREQVGAAALLGIAAAFLLFLGVVGFELSKPKRSLPRLLYFFVCLLHPTVPYAAIALGEGKLVLFYLVAYLWSHWMIATGLVWRINNRFHESRGRRPGFAVMQHLVMLLATAGVVLLVMEPFKGYALFSSPRYEEVLAAIPSDQTLLVGVILGFFLGEQLLHYYCDRCLFRFRDPEVRRRVAPLLLGANRPH